MKNNPFKQGPMSKSEAEEISKIYQKRGNTALITPSFDNNETFFVFINLPESNQEPKPSRTYENSRLWGY